MYFRGLVLKFNPWVPLHTANLYRDLQGFYREIGVQGFHIYRDLLGIKLAVIFTVILHEIYR